MNPLQARFAKYHRSLGWSLLLMLATLAGGLVIRFLPLGLPPPVMKYGGSMLWAMLIYWVISSLVSDRKLLQGGLLSALLATAIELFKLFYAPGLDAFRRTLPGILLLGRIFSVWDILAYWLAILLGMSLDGCIRRRGRKLVPSAK